MPWPESSESRYRKRKEFDDPRDTGFQPAIDARNCWLCIVRSEIRRDGVWRCRGRWFRLDPSKFACAWWFPDFSSEARKVYHDL